MAATKTVAHRGRVRKSGVPDILAANPLVAIHPRNGVVTLFGYGIQARVDRGHLILEDGIGRDRRYARYPRVGHGLKRLVVIGSDGMVSLAALRWLSDQNAAFVMLDRAGKVMTTVGPSRTPEARTRRAQGLALQSGAGLGIARELISRKLSGQEHVARNRLHNSEVGDAIIRFQANLSSAKTFETIRFLEAQAASAYWSAWRGLAVAFPKNDLPRVPAHWQTFQSRSSPLSGKSARLAADPPNAMLNYLYAVLESEARLAASALGLDPSLGFLHSDTAYRDSLVFDLMEPVRPMVDGFVFDWISREVLKRDWFFEESNGNCRLMAELACKLSETSEMWRRALAPIAEFVTRSLWASQHTAAKSKEPATHLTQQHRREASDRATTSQVKTGLKPQSLCRTCGVPVSKKRQFCVACAATYSAANLARGADKGRNSTRSPENRARHAKIASVKALAQWSWDPTSQPDWLDQNFYVTRITPLLGKTTVAAIASAIEVSRFYAGEIRRGNRIPHPRNWVKLAELVGFRSLQRD
jgi:CRISPR-associated endonuclease Cas1